MSKEQVNVIYHRADYDGLFSAAVCHHWLEKQGIPHVCYGWDFVDPKLPNDTEDRLIDLSLTTYIVDLPPSCIDAPPDSQIWSNIIWIDHHASAIANADWKNLPGYRIDGVAACRLAWAYFSSPPDDDGVRNLPAKECFINRTVREPEAIRLAGEYDVWDKRDADAEAFQYGLTASYPHWIHLRPLLADVHECKSIINDGKVIQAWQQAFAKPVCQERGYLVELECVPFWTLCSAHCRSSSWFIDSVIPAEAEALMCWRFNGKMIDVSLYHRPGHEHYDLSRIATKYGGGGHKGACGFRCTVDSEVGRLLLGVA